MDNVRVVRLLLEHGADVDVRGNSGKTPSELAWLPEIVGPLSAYDPKSVE